MCMCLMCNACKCVNVCMCVECVHVCIICVLKVYMHEHIFYMQVYMQEGPERIGDSHTLE